MTKHQGKPSNEDVQSNLAALNRTYTTYNDTASRITQLQAERAFYVYYRWLVQHGVQFYLDLKSNTFKLGVTPAEHTRSEEGGDAMSHYD